MNPIAKSHVPTIMKEQSEHSVSHIGLGKVLKGKGAIIQLELMNQIDVGYRFLLQMAYHSCVHLSTMGRLLILHGKILHQK